MIRVLDLGCGVKPIFMEEAEVVYLDRVKFPYVDVVWDLNKFPYPFKSNTFDVVFARHVIEHLNYPIKTINEIWRILKPKGILKIWVPYYKSHTAFTDPTHKHYFTPFSFDYWDPTNLHFYYLHYQLNSQPTQPNPKARFKIIKKELHFFSFLKLLTPFTRLNTFLWFYELVLSNLLPPPYEIYVEMEAIK